MTARDLGASLPTGTVTLLLADVEGSVRLWETDREAMTAAARRLDELASEILIRHGGARPVEQGEGDSFVLAFTRASDAARCALDLQRAITKEPWPGGLDLRVRMALHTGDVRLRDEENYAGPAVNRCARIRALAHGGQTVLSRATHDVAADDLPPDATLKDLGEHRLRDLARPERVYQLVHPDLPDDFPALRSLSALPNNLPQQLTSFIGRETEMREVRKLLNESRMLTLTGAGGCGKTRLALQVAAELVDEYPDGVWWIELAPLADPELVATAVAGVVAIQEIPTERLADTLARRLRERRLLLVLDNCEHLVTACAELAGALLRGCPGLAILATTREPLGVEGETSYRIPSLPVPEMDHQSPDELAGYDAVRLFADRAARARPNFRVGEDTIPAVVEICRRLDGIPLAIELAAARTRVMSPAQIAAGLSDRFRLLTGGTRTALPRQRTLEASVDWSYALLSEQERLLLARLSVFAGSFSLEAAEEVCAGGEIDRYGVFDALSSLADKSLAQVEEDGSEGRYRLLETIRAYARQKLTDSGEAAAVRTRHLDHLMAFVERAEPELLGGSSAEWFDRVDADLDNVRGAMEWAIDSGQGEKCLRIAGAGWIFWQVRARHGEARRWLRTALEAGHDADPAVRAKALMGAVAASFSGDFATTHGYAEEAVDIARRVGDSALLARALAWVGWAEFFIGRGPGRPQIEEAIRLSREIGHAFLASRSLYMLGVVVGFGSSFDEGCALIQESIALARKEGHTVTVAHALHFLGMISGFAGRLEDSEEALEEALTLFRSLREESFSSFALMQLGFAATMRGDYDRAARLIDESVPLARDSGAVLFELEALWGRGVLHRAIGNLEQAAKDAQDALEGMRSLGLSAGTGTAILWLVAAVALRRGDRETARSALKEIREATGLVWALGHALLELARLSRLEGDIAHAEERAHEALRALRDYGDRIGVVDCLETLGSLAASVESHREAARLLGAAHRLREEIGYVRFPVEREEYEQGMVRVREALGEDAFAAAWAEGAAMSLDETVAYAERGRGERKRPTAGWAALTPTELDVVRLVAQGLTNPEIAKKLFVARNTVKVHLQHVFAKLGVATRAELAAEATRRGL